MSKRVLGLDVGSTTGWAVWDGSGLEHGVVRFEPPKKGRKTLPDDHPGKRFAHFHAWLRHMLGYHRPTDIAYEIPAAQSRYNAMLLFGFRSILAMQAHFYGIRFHETYPTTLKKWSTGKGNATKDDMLEAWLALPLGVAATDHEIDACWLTRWAWEEIIMKGPNDNR